jgi:hypothetical protein
MRDRATGTGIAIAGIRNSHRHHPRERPMTKMAMPAYRQQVAAVWPDG